MDDYFIYFGIIEFGLLFIPVCAYLLWKKLKTNKNYLMTFYSFIVFLGTLRLFNLTFYGDIFDYVLPIGVYLGYCILIFYSLLIKSRFLKLISFIIGLTPVIIGYVVATVGFVGIILISANLVPEKTVKINDKLYFREYSYGNATSSEGGKEIEIYKRVTTLPFIEKRILKQRMSDLRFNVDSLKINLDETDEQYKIRIHSNDKLQFDTLVLK